jgi:hypothetical protein
MDIGFVRGRYVMWESKRIRTGVKVNCSRIFVLGMEVIDPFTGQEVCMFVICRFLTTRSTT